MTVQTVAVAGRGEIAKRIVSVCRLAGLKSVLLHAAGDTQNEAFRLADERICIGPADPLQSYLNTEAVIEGAKAGGAGALHPGYGFLSESLPFAESCHKAGLVFIGPPLEALAVFGNKVQTKRLCQKAGAPVLPSRSGAYETEGEALAEAQSLGFPLMIKAACGGGGRGLREVRKREKLWPLFQEARREAALAFPDKEFFFLEKLLEGARHIEVQLFVDAAGEIFVLGDRDCSAQRRRQKILEEAPAPALSKALKKEMQEAARAVLELADYRGPGTAEFLVYRDKFYFLEINPRLQVEHTVTEAAFGIDLVRAQMLTAFERPAFLDKSLKARGCSIQCRLFAEDPFNGFLPETGRLHSCSWPLGPGVRADVGFAAGDMISAEYDSLIAKIITHDISRGRAAEKARAALEETVVFGCRLNTAFLSRVLCLPEFLEGRLTTDFLDKAYPKGLPPEPLPLEEEFLKKLFQETKDSKGELGGRGEALAESRRKRFNPWSDFL